MYLMAALEEEKEKTAEGNVLWVPPPPITPEVFHWHQEPNRRQAYVSPPTQEETGLESSAFVPPPNIHPLPSEQDLVKSTAEIHWKAPLPHPSKEQPPLVKSAPEAHRDKIGSGRENKVGMSFQEESIRIRRGPDKMRIIEQPMVGQIEVSGQSRKTAKLRKRNIKMTPVQEMAEGDFEDDIY